MNQKIAIKEIKPINIEGGYLIDGFPSIGFTSAIASESMISSSQFELAGIVDSDCFFPLSIVKNGIPNFPTRIFVNSELKVGIFLSYYRLDESIHRLVANAMLEWAKKHKCSLIVSSVAINSNIGSSICAVASTEFARTKLKEAGIPILKEGTIPGLPSILLNNGVLNDQNVVVLVFGSSDSSPDFKAGAQLCLAMSTLIPGSSCDIKSLQREAEIAEQNITKTEKETDALKSAIYG